MYTIKELLQNNSFRRMVQGTASSQEIEQWNRWIEENETNRRNALEASSRILGFKFQDPQGPDIKKEWNSLKRGTVEPADPKIKSLPSRRSRTHWIFQVAAAAVLLLASIGIGLYITSGQAPSPLLDEQIVARTVSTDSGEQKSITLSDGSTIVLNTNSSLTYRDGWVQGKVIRVELKGEAFFHVIKRTSEDQPEFQVVTPGGIIRDMGTKFTVSVQKNRTQVVLQEGWVHVETTNETDSSQGMDVRVGELVEFNEDRILNKEKVNPTFYSSWATGFLRLDYTPIREFADYIQQQFNVRVVISDPALADKQINGAVYYRELNDLVRSVAKVLKTPVYRSADSDTVFIGQPNQ